MKSVLLCGTAPVWLQKAFSEYGYSLICLGTCKALPDPTAGHIDLMSASIAGTLFLAEEAEPLFRPYIPYEQKTVICTRTLGKKYPKDVLLSVRQSGRHLICHPRYSAKEIRYFAEKCHITCIPVHQGYVACTTLAIADRAVITDDPSIAKTLQASGLKVLQVLKGSVNLPGYNYGFLGGASVYLNGTVYFFGDLRCHADFRKIEAFLKRIGVPWVSLKAGMPLQDIGGILPVKEFS